MENMSYNESAHSFLKRALLKLLLAVTVLLALTCVHIIPTGCTGVRTFCGQIDPKPVQSGRIIYTIPLAEHIETVNNKQQEFRVEDKIWGETNDKTPVYANDVIVTYQIAVERSAWIYANVSDYTKHLLTENLVASAAKSAMVELAPGDVTNRGKIEPLIQRKLEESLAAKYGAGTVLVNKVTVGDMDFEAAYNKAIQAKSIASQEQAKTAIENQTAIEKAEAGKQVAVLKAEAKAEQVRIAAEAEADANRMIQESLTDSLIEKKKVEAWDGKLPAVVGSGTLVGLDAFTGEK